MYVPKKIVDIKLNVDNHLWLPEEEEVVDTTGAGDGFAAGFICSLTKSDNLRRACILGHRVASVVVKQKGACVRPVTMQQATAVE